MAIVQQGLFDGLLAAGWLMRRPERRWLRSLRFGSIAQIGFIRRRGSGGLHRDGEIKTVAACI